MTDAWTSPNHKAFVTVAVHFSVNGEMVSMLLDIVEVTKNHTDLNLAVEFARIVEDFGIEGKVSIINVKSGIQTYHPSATQHRV